MHWGVLSLQRSHLGISTSILEVSQASKWQLVAAQGCCGRHIRLGPTLLQYLAALRICSDTPGCEHRYLGLFTTEVEAAQAYDRESVMRKGVHAITNFDLAHYADLLSPDDLAEAGRRGLLGAGEADRAEEGLQAADWPEQPDEKLPDEAAPFHGAFRGLPTWHLVPAKALRYLTQAPANQPRMPGHSTEGTQK